MSRTINNFLVSETIPTQKKSFNQNFRQKFKIVFFSGFTKIFFTYFKFYSNFKNTRKKNDLKF